MSEARDEMASTSSAPAATFVIRGFENMVTRVGTRIDVAKEQSDDNSAIGFWDEFYHALTSALHVVEVLQAAQDHLTGEAEGLRRRVEELEKWRELTQKDIVFLDQHRQELARKVAELEERLNTPVSAPVPAETESEEGQD